MFTGLIEDVGTVESVNGGADGARLRIATKLAEQVEPGDSIAVNGVCLTATAVSAERFETEAMNQTLSVTALGGVEAGGRVNLELAMKASDRLGGHIVQGHVDGVGRWQRLRTMDSPNGCAWSSLGACCATPCRRARLPSTGSA